MAVRIPERHSGGEGSDNENKFKNSALHALGDAGGRNFILCARTMLGAKKAEGGSGSPGNAVE